MKQCSRCILPADYPDIHFDTDGVCNHCHSHTVKKHDRERFSTEQDLKAYLESIRQPRKQQAYDVLVPVSGGVDSCWSLIKMVETFDLKPLVFHNDHGFEYETATENVKKLCRAYHLDLIIFQHEHQFMKDIWKSLIAYDGTSGSYFCFICGSILTATAVELAQTFGIPLIVNGFTKGQAEMCRPDGRGGHWMSGYLTWMEKHEEWRSTREHYLMKTSIFDKVDFFDNIDANPSRLRNPPITLIPFYVFRFYKTDKEKLIKACRDRFQWRPQPESYPARTTNCRMNWLSAFMDLKKNGRTWYHEEYAALIRNGEMTREEALRDLAFDPPEGIIHEILSSLDLHTDSRTSDLYGKFLPAFSPGHPSNAGK